MTKKLVIRACCDRQHIHVICNRFHGRLANNDRITTFRGTTFWCPCVQFPWTWKVETWTVEIYIQCWKFHMPLFLNHQKIPKNLFWRSKTSKVIEFGGNREPVYDFLLVINSNLGLISHRYWDAVTYWPKIANFAHPLSFSALVQGDPLQIYGKALRFLKLGSSRQPTVWRFGALFLTDPPVWWTDGQTELRWLRHAKTAAAFAGKKPKRYANKRTTFYGYQIARN